MTDTASVNTLGGSDHTSTEEKYERKHTIAEVSARDTQLRSCTCKNTKPFSFDGSTVRAKCLSVYDGDTITVAFDVYGNFYKFNIRMNGYDAPEMKPDKTSITYNIAKMKAIEARDHLASLLLDKIIKLECGPYDKYGRILGTVYYDGVNINEQMISMGYGKPYDGGTKEQWVFNKNE